MKVEAHSAVIPGPAEGRNPESRKAGSPGVTGFRVRAFGAPRNDGAKLQADA
jgi:hypothetical protein